MSKHEWRDNTPDGDVLFTSAHRQSGKWTFKTKLKSEEDWTEVPRIPMDDLEYLREVLWNKYQRRRVPYEQVLELDDLIVRAKKRKKG